MICSCFLQSRVLGVKYLNQASLNFQLYFIGISVIGEFRLSPTLMAETAAGRNCREKLRMLRNAVPIFVLSLGQTSATFLPSNPNNVGHLLGIVCYWWVWG